MCDVSSVLARLLISASARTYFRMARVRRCDESNIHAGVGEDEVTGDDIMQLRIICICIAFL